VEFRILGPLEVLDDGRTVPLGGPRQRALLAVLLTRSNQVVSTDSLIDELWGAEPPKAALNTIQHFVSQLRKSLGEGMIVTRPPGYLVRVDGEALDLRRFERLVAEAQNSEPGDAARLLHEALGLWRGPPLADFALEEFAQAEIARLEELRLLALELRIDAELALGRHAQLAAELDALVRVHPLRERLRAQGILALYRSGRQADALAAYGEARRVLAEEVGLDPGPELQRLQKAILMQDPQLELEPSGRSQTSVLVVGRSDPLLALGESLARRPPRELIHVGLASAVDELAPLAAELNDRRADAASRGVETRTAAFTSRDIGADVARLASEHNADLVLVEAPAGLLERGVFPPDTAKLLALVSADVAILSPQPLPPEGTILVPFSGADDDWAAVEIAAWLASARGAPLGLVGASDERGDASRLLARASLIVQRAVGIPTQPLLVAAGAEGILRAAAGGAVLVVGLSPRWRQEGLGTDRLMLARAAPVPTLFVRRGLRPSGVAPPGSATRFTWSLSGRV
jgi:DNA-binding SARP family transcriptional activator